MRCAEAEDASPEVRPPAPRVEIGRRHGWRHETREAAGHQLPGKMTATTLPSLVTSIMPSAAAWSRTSFRRPINGTRRFAPRVRKASSPPTDAKYLKRAWKADCR